MKAARIAGLFLLSLAASIAQQQRPEEKAEPPKTPVAEEAKDVSGDPLFKGMRYRSIGPFRGGRSLTVAGIPGDPTTYYFGGVGGGVWKSTDGAMTWSPIFDKEGTAAIGSLAVALSDPNIVTSEPARPRCAATSR